MLTFRARIKSIADNDLDGFEFPSTTDESAFRQVINDRTEHLSRVVQGRRYTACHYAWETLRALGWFHTGSEDKYLTWQKPETDVEKLEMLLRVHDWWYMMSDSYSVYSDGELERKEIEALMQVVGEPTASALYQKYSPYPPEKGNTP